MIYMCSLSQRRRRGVCFPAFGAHAGRVAGEVVIKRSVGGVQDMIRPGGSTGRREFARLYVRTKCRRAAIDASEGRQNGLITYRPVGMLSLMAASKSGEPGSSAWRGARCVTDGAQQITATERMDPWSLSCWPPRDRGARVFACSPQLQDWRVRSSKRIRRVNSTIASRSDAAVTSGVWPFRWVATSVGPRLPTPLTEIAYPTL